MRIAHYRELELRRNRPGVAVIFRKRNFQFSIWPHRDGFGAL